MDNEVEMLLLVTQEYEVAKANEKEKHATPNMAKCIPLKTDNQKILQNFK